MPDDWPGHPQRKDYPLGGIPVEYKGATIPPPDQRRSLQLMTDTTTDAYAPPTRDHRGHGSSPSPARTGTPIAEGIADGGATSGSSSTWGRSTPRRTACSG